MNPSPQIPVLVFMTSFEPGGTERQMIELVRRLDPNRFKVHVGCFRKEGAWLPRVAERAASIVAFPVRGFARPATAIEIGRFVRWCRREHIAVVQTADFYANAFALPAAFLAGVPVRVGSRRELNPDKSPAQIRLQRLAYRFASRVVANSPAAVDILATEGLPPAQRALIANGVESDAYPDRPPRGRIRRIITVANLRPEKSHETLIAAAAALLLRCPDLRYQIVGGGARRHELEALARARGVADRIAFLGHREDIPSLLAAADLFVLPSRSEAFPNAAIEAMAAGLPVVASAVGGFLDLIDDGTTGFLVDPANPEALASMIEQLAEDPLRAERAGVAARREVRTRYSFDRMVRAFEDLYESELRSRHWMRTAQARAGI